MSYREAASAHTEDVREALRGRPLTEREIQILAVLATGITQPAAANRLGISVQTLKNHTWAAYARLDVDNLVAAFVKLGWLRTRPYHVITRYTTYTPPVVT